VKQRIVLSVIVVGLVVAAFALLRSHYRDQVAQLEPRAKKFDDICGLAKSAIFVDRTMLKTEDDRKLLFSKFAGHYIGDGFAMLQWCIPNVETFVDEFRRCQNIDDYKCLDRVLESMSAAIALP